LNFKVLQGQVPVTALPSAKLAYFKPYRNALNQLPEMI
jgi:hypothetical protein